MDLDDELRRLFTDDRLDLQVRPGTGERILTGARRLRRRRTAVGGTFAIALCGIMITNLGGTQSLPPASSSVLSPPPAVITETHTIAVTASPPTDGPARYGKLWLGMSGQDALATGVLLQPSTFAMGECPGYRSESVPNDMAAVVVSPSKGVARISLPGFARTAAGIGAGSSAADVRAKYPAAVAENGGLTVAMPGEPGWRYRLLIDGDQKVTTVRMELTTSECTFD